MFIRLLKVIPFKTLKKYMSHIKQITGSNKQYATKPHIDILFVCVDKEYQGKRLHKAFGRSCEEICGRRECAITV